MRYARTERTASRPFCSVFRASRRTNAPLRFQEAFAARRLRYPFSRQRPSDPIAKRLPNSIYHFRHMTKIAPCANFNRIRRSILPTRPSFFFSGFASLLNSFQKSDLEEAHRQDACFETTSRHGDATPSRTTFLHPPPAPISEWAPRFSAYAPALVSAQLFSNKCHVPEPFQKHGNYFPHASPAPTSRMSPRLNFYISPRFETRCALHKIPSRFRPQMNVRSLRFAL